MVLTNYFVLEFFLLSQDIACNIFVLCRFVSKFAAAGLSKNAKHKQPGQHLRIQNILQIPHIPAHIPIP